MNLRSIRAFAPATVANVTCGFDVIGFAINNPGDEVIIRLINDKKLEVIIKEITGDNGVLPYAADKNTASVAVSALLLATQSNVSLEITLNKKMPLGSGLGSSAASAAAAVVAVNELLKLGLSQTELIPFAMAGEKIASGSAHADNVAPAIFGGFTLIRSYEPLDIIKITTPDDLYASVVHPHIEINTRDARSVIRQNIEFKKVVQQLGNLAGLIAGLTMADYDLISRSMHDVIVEPARSILLPGFTQVKKSALANKALGAGISGSGPSIFAISRGSEIASVVGTAMLNEFKNLNINGEVFVSQINKNGCIILD